MQVSRPGTHTLVQTNFKFTLVKESLTESVFSDYMSQGRSQPWLSGGAKLVSFPVAR